MVASSIDADRTLGLFTGVSFTRAIEVSQRLPPQIILFLDNITSTSAATRPSSARR